MVICMRVLAVIAVLCGAVGICSQSPYVAESQRELRHHPPLPVITQPVLPGEGWEPGTYRLNKSIAIFDRWQSPHIVHARLLAHASVTLISGLNEVEKPDLIVMTSPIPVLSLSLGDTILRYTQRGEGNADFWAKGMWYTNGDLGWVKNADGSGCETLCKAEEKEAGRSVWWFKVRLADSRIGWTDSLDSPNLY